MIKALNIYKNSMKLQEISIKIAIRMLYRISKI
jgi:hypothetical protein